MTRRIQNIQALRGVAVLMVAVFHLAGMEAQFGGGERLLPDLAGCGRAGVDLFFIISGFIMVATTAGGGRGPAAAGRFLHHRATRIYPAYWFYTLALIGLHFLLPRFADAARWATVNVARSLLLLPQAELPVLVVGWTMVHEVYFYLVFSLLLLTPEQSRGWLLGAWLAATAALAAVFPALAAASPVFAVATHPLTAEFIAGAAIALLVRRGLLVPGRAALAAGAILLLAGHALLAPAGPGLTAWPEGWTRVAVYGLPSALLLAGAVSIEFTGGSLLPRWLRAVGDASYSIYLAQIFPLLALGWIWSWLRVPGPADNAAAVAVAGIAVVAAGLAGYHLVERPLLALTRRRRAPEDRLRGPRR